MMQQEQKNKQMLVSAFLKKGALLNPEFLIELNESSFEESLLILTDEKISAPLFIDRDTLTLLQKPDPINWKELEKTRALAEKGKNRENYKKFIGYLSDQKKQLEIKETKEKTDLKVIGSFECESKKRDVQDFVEYFNKRYRAIEKILKERLELKNTISINRLKQKKDRDHIAIIGSVLEKRITKNKNIIITLEDPTACTRVLINKNKKDLYDLGNSLVLDETIGITGVNAENIIFADNLFLPEIPLGKELKKSSEEGCALFLSDIHVGSDNFLSSDFDKFLRWINLESGNERQKELASRVKYIFIVGDLVDGCGIYPGQEEELTIKEITAQYEECARLLKKIPQHIKIVICPGNHDAMRISEPQPPLVKEFAGSLYSLPNVIITSNPSWVNISSTASFPGFDVLLYHGYSFDYFISEVDNIRNNGGYDRGDLVMKFLLKRRHLAPTHTSTLYIPEKAKDHLVIDRIPDFFVSGHIHKSVVANYRNITMICGSCWQAKTKFQEKVGHNPEPGRVPLVNLKTREIKILKFSR